MNPKIIAVDFDGTLAENAWPGIGAPIQDTIDALKAEQAAGCVTILWTNRTGERLAEAVAWCAAQGIRLDYINENTPGMIEFFGGDCRKVFANEYWDDRAVRMPELVCHMTVKRERFEDQRSGTHVWVHYCDSCNAEFEMHKGQVWSCPSCGARIARCTNA